MTLALVLLLVAMRSAHAKDDDMIELTGCVQGFAQGGYFFSDVVNDKGKVKHYLLVNNNEEVKQFEGKMVKVVGTPAPFGWSVKFETRDNRTLKTSDVFGVDTVAVVQPSCEAPSAVVAR
jgi:hypothetical protein